MDIHRYWLLGCRDSAGLLSSIGMLLRCSSKGLILHSSTHYDLSKTDCPLLVCFLMMQHEDKNIKGKDNRAWDGWGGSHKGSYFPGLAPHCLPPPDRASLLHIKPSPVPVFLPLCQLPISFPNDLEPSPSLLLLSPFLSIALDGHWPSLFCLLSSSALLWYLLFFILHWHMAKKQLPSLMPICHSGTVTGPQLRLFKVGNSYPGNTLSYFSAL